MYVTKSLPFPLTKEQSFYEALGEWIGDVFYDILPEKGFEIRDEQIFMAFQLEKAFQNKEVMFAEAGVGTGKTLAYLLYSLCYARYTGKPGIIACADETLIEQLVKKEGDIHKLESALGLSIDVRLAKSRDQYLCVKKLQINETKHDEFMDIYEELPEFVTNPKTMSKYEAYGDRKDHPDLNDEKWSMINWDATQDCLSCDIRHRCGLTLQRETYRKAKDLIICSHDFYMEHIWTKESRKREGQLPLLPESSSVVFDEGHLLEFASQKALTYKMTENTVEDVLEMLTSNDIREKTLHLIDEVLILNEQLFKHLRANSFSPTGEERLHIERTKSVLDVAKKLKFTIDQLTDELVFEGELFVIAEYDLRVVEEYLEQMLYSLTLFVSDNAGIIWLEEDERHTTLVMMPRLVQEVLKEEVFSQKKPYVFSSATLSSNKDFTYMAQSLGIEDYSSFTVNSPFEYDEKMNIEINVFKQHEQNSFAFLLKQLQGSEGRSLILFATNKDLLQFKDFMKTHPDMPFSMYYEGAEEISNLVSHFQNDINSVLCTYHLWEGLDIPGESLSSVLIHALPFPPFDPVFEAKRQGTTNPFNEVDLPYMLLRLRQGIGRLIRTSEDEGNVKILVSQSERNLIPVIESVLPTTAKIQKY
ncbi:ATP-dependent DNA helicase [Bacillus sp. 2205SS5-2]|uniref:ATP-dependent DNA helicase n=1 Tax=Bacillus sp. 2205SS5-2 TaxID=3109031 RepID=UPI0030068FA4